MPPPAPDPVEAAAGAFPDTWGGPPEGVWAAPGRLNLIGEHTDYNGGRSLPIALHRGVAVAVRRRSDGRLRARSLEEGTAEVDLADVGPGTPPGWLGYVAGALWALAGTGVAVGGLDAVVAADLPVGAGLSSSAALSCAALLAARDLWGGPDGLVDLARLAQRAENDVVGVPTGLLDQLASLGGREGHAMVVKAATGETRPVPLDLDGPGVALLVVDTGGRRALAAGGYAERRAWCEEAAAALHVTLLCDADLPGLERARAAMRTEAYRAARHVLSEDARVGEAVDALAQGRPADLGRLLTASHRSLRNDFAVSTAALDLAVDAALGAGALGARMTGAGFGGCAVALLPADAAGEVADAVTAAFAGAGLPAPAVFAARPGPGARRVR